jgi:prepilin-type processing-associated H-X9-DG protein
MENKDCSDSGGRNVLFADGHVEFIKESDWDTRMGPYLKYAYE